MVTALTILAVLGLILTGRWRLVAKNLERLGADLVPVIALIVLMVALFLVRLPWAFQYYAFTPDMASYLMTRNYVLGTDYGWPPDLHTRPPLMGLALVPLTFVFGDLWGSKLLALGISVFVAVPAYVLARYWLRPWWAFGAAAIIVLQPFTGMYMIGGSLPLVAYAFAVLALRALLDRSWWTLFLTFCMAGFNGTIIPIYALAGFVLVVPDVLRNPFKSPAAKWRGFVILVASGLVMLPWLYWFVQMPPAPVFPGPFLALTNFPETLLYLAVVVAFMPAFVLIPKLRTLGVLCAIFAVVSNIGSAHNTVNAVMWRSHYMVPTFLVIGCLYLFATGLDHARRRHTAKRFHATAAPQAGR
jgi:hypothetical protein